MNLSQLVTIRAVTSPRVPLNYSQSRTVLLLFGLIALTVLGGTMWVRGVEPIEVSATIFFIPLFAAIVLFGLPGGLIIGALASIAYIVIRIPSIQAIGLESLAGLLVARVVGYMVFGAVGGWATRSLGASIRKLEQVDRVDDETFLHNARAFLEQVELERARAERYSGVFSAVVLSFDNGDLDKRTRAALMQSLGTHLRVNVRSVDEITHARDNGTDLFGFVLPQTDASGTEVFVEKLRKTLETIVPGERDFESTIATFPEDSADLSVIVDRFHKVSAREHPVSI